MADRVRSHTRRTPSGGTTKVTSHGRKGKPRKGFVTPGHAFKLLRKALQVGRKRKRTAAVVLGLLGVTEIVLWLSLEGVALVLATAGVLMLSTGVLAAAAGGVRK